MKTFVTNTDKSLAQQTLKSLPKIYLCLPWSVCSSKKTICWTKVCVWIRVVIGTIVVVCLQYACPFRRNIRDLIS